MELAIGEMMKEDTLFDFKDGADNLRLIKAMKDVCGKPAKGPVLPSWA